MKIFRQFVCTRSVVVLSIVWLVFIVIVFNIMQHESDEYATSHVSRAIKKLGILQKRHIELTNLLIDFSSRLKEDDQKKLLGNLKQIVENRGLLFEPNTDYEILRRRVQFNIQEMWYYMQSQIIGLREKQYSQLMTKQLNNIISLTGEYKRSLLKDVSLLSENDGYAEWRRTEDILLSSLVQRRLQFLQNPPDCQAARKLVCDLNKGCGFGCQLHHVVYCFIVAYATERTMILKSQGWRYSRLGWEKAFLPVSNTCLLPDGATTSTWPGSKYTQVITIPIIESISPRPSYLPLSVPADLAPRLVRIHSDPVVWWIGQFLKYLLRPQPLIKQLLDKYTQQMGFQKPIVGIHIRRTDKIGTEAAYHKLEEYMMHVEEYYNSLELTGKIFKRKVYIASDEPKVFEELDRVVQVKKNKLLPAAVQELTEAVDICSSWTNNVVVWLGTQCNLYRHTVISKYPDYEIIGNLSISKSASVGSRYSEHSLHGIILDIHFLSLSDYLVCTFSSQVCRVAYELMNSLYPDSASKFRSLDDIYYYGGQKARYQTAVLEHTSSVDSEEIDLKVGDVISVAGNHWNGYSKGTNLRTYKSGLYPTFKVIPKVETANFPVYSQIPLEEV